MLGASTVLANAAGSFVETKSVQEMTKYAANPRHYRPGPTKLTIKIAAKLQSKMIEVCGSVASALGIASMEGKNITTQTIAGEFLKNLIPFSDINQKLDDELA